jgi:Mor family transcriptional regulator
MRRKPPELSCPLSQWIEMAPKSDRNRQIFAAFEAGETLEQLGEFHGLSPTRIHAILMAEKHKRTVSPEPFYRSLRAAMPI